MSLQLFYAWAKKIHKWLLWFVTILGSWMMISGYMMHKELERGLLFNIDMDFVRVWHNGVSQYFLVVLLAQMATGLVMWGVPKILSNRAQSKRVME